MKLQKVVFKYAKKSIGQIWSWVNPREKGQGIVPKSDTGGNHRRDVDDVNNTSEKDPIRLDVMLEIPECIRLDDTPPNVKKNVEQSRDAGIKALLDKIHEIKENKKTRTS